MWYLPNGLVQVCLCELEILRELQAGEDELLHLLVHPVLHHISDGEIYKKRRNQMRIIP